MVTAPPKSKEHFYRDIFTHIYLPCQTLFSHVSPTVAASSKKPICIRGSFALFEQKCFQGISDPADALKEGQAKAKDLYGEYDGPDRRKMVRRAQLRVL